MIHQERIDQEGLKALFNNRCEPGFEKVYAEQPNGESTAVSAFDGFRQRPPAKPKRFVHIWHCCACGKAGIRISVDQCPDCGEARCVYCRTEKVRVQ